MNIKVTQDHIDNGKSGCKLCPVALALKDATGISYNVTSSTICKSFLDHDILLPEKVRKFIGRFDKGREVEPFEFYIDL